MRWTVWLAIAALACAAALGCTRSSSSRTVVVGGNSPPPAALALTGVDANNGPAGGGNLITISGTGFLTGANVTFEGTLGTNAQVLSPTTLIVTVPSGGVGPADLVVTLADGRSATLVNGYQYGTPAPIVSAIAPTSGAIAGGTLVTITGTGFVRNGAAQATVTIGGNPATNVTVVGAGTITAITPASGVSGAVNVTVTNPDLLSSTLPGGFTYQADTTPPTFAGVTGVKAVSAYALEVSWAAATDDSTASSLLTYAVYRANSPGTQNFAAPVAITGPGARRFTVGGLTPFNNYYFVVRAIDLSGNEDANTAERMGTTLTAASPAWGAAGAMNTARADACVVVLTDGRVLAAGGRNGGGVQLTAELYDPATGTWSNTGSMSTFRDQAAAALLPDGRVLVTGGTNATVQFATCEIWDPTTGTWAATGAMATARQRHGLTLLAGGKLLAAGGLNGSGPVGTAELYDPATGTWAATGSFGTARDWHHQVLLSDGRVLAAGGGGGAGILATAEIYNPGTATWTTTGGMNGGRLGGLMVALRDGRVLLAGGLDPTSTPLATAELFTPATGSWAVTGAMSGARVFPSGVLLPSGRVAAAGGGNNSVEEFDPGTGQWTAVQGFQTARDSHRAALLSDGRMFLVGGQNGGGQLAGCELETTVRGNWIPSASAQVSRGRQGATVLPDGRVLVAGGYTGSSQTGFFATATSELYDPDTDAWTNTGNFNNARFGFSFTLLPDGRVLAASGTSTGNNVLGSELYDPATGGWSSVSGPIFGRMNHSGTLLRDGRVLVVGGWTGTLILNQSELFNPAANTWANSGSMTGGRGWHGSARLADGRVLVAGGWDGFQPINTAEIYDPTTGTWSVTASFTTARYGATCTLLRDGRVLLAGGSDNVNQQTMCNLYDPSTGTWTQAAPLPAASLGHTATLLASGRVLVAGGFVQPQVYDPIVNTWYTAPNLGTARFIHTANLLRDGRVFLHGGSNGVSLAGSELWDPGLGASQQWRPVITSVGTDTTSPTTLSYSATVTVNGTGLRGRPEGGTGNFTNAVDGGPIVQFTGPMGSAGAYLDTSPATEILSFPATFTADGTRVDIQIPATTAVGPGYYQLRVIAGGVASEAWVVRLP